MDAVIRSKLIDIGNSRGVRIPKTLLKQARLSEEVELRAEPNCIIVRSAESPRQVWSEAFAAMAACGDDRLLDDVQLPTIWDETEWQWE